MMRPTPFVGATGGVSGAGPGRSASRSVGAPQSEAGATRPEAIGSEARADRTGVTMYEAITRGIRVTVVPEFQSDRSEPDEGRWFWSYTVEITNTGDEPVRLRARHWRIVDSRGQTQEVSGPGVVGEQPLIEPGESFEYTSGCPLATASGFMLGSYRMQGADGEFFDVDIPAFSLDVPQTVRVLN
jgi:ApaG protein